MSVRIHLTSPPSFHNGEAGEATYYYKESFISLYSHRRVTEALEYGKVYSSWIADHDGTT